MYTYHKNNISIWKFLFENNIQIWELKNWTCFAKKTVFL